MHLSLVQSMLFYSFKAGIVVVLSAASAIIAAMLPAYLSRNKKLRLNKSRNIMKEGLGPKEWEQHMAELSRIHNRVKWKRKSFIVRNYNQLAYKKINIIRSIISEASNDIITLVPSARCLFDNFHMMYREIKKVKTTGTGYLSLPVLLSTEYRGYPRIYVVAEKMAEISGGYLSEENVFLMINAYQKENPLFERELQALPEMIGLCLLERIINVSDEIVRVINIKSKAENFVKERFVEKQGYIDVSPLLTDLGDNGKDVSFHSHVVFYLKNMSVDESDIKRYISYHYKSEGMDWNASDIFKEEGRKESLLESCIHTPIVSLRELNQINNEELVEKLSLVEHILSKDPDCVYPDMDSISRGMYRTVAEKLAMKCGVNSDTIAEACLSLASAGRDGLYRSHHVGAYLIGRGYPLLKAKVLNRPIPSKIRNGLNLKGALYFLMSMLFFAAAVFLLIYSINSTSAVKPYKTVILLVVAVPMLIDAALKISSNIKTRLVPVQELPLLDYSEEIPDSARTIVVMPVIISTKEQGLEYVERLHKHYLANRQPNLYFALLADYADASGKDMRTDKAIKDVLVARIEQLNKESLSMYRKFSLFIRERIWKESENCFMSWERKRGKLEEFNALLNGIDAENTSFTTFICDRELLETYKYVITLDADSDLVKDNAAKLTGMIDHPLNRALIDPVSNKIKEGYVIIQPHVRNHIYGKNAALFPKVFGGSSGLANYSMVVSDIYQDLFREGTFVGKGIYDAKAFHRLLYGKIPENRVLSHDLLESCYARTAFAGLANIVESFPGSYISYSKREHRWIRGDWQLLPWLLKKDISLLSKWKIADNMRVSLIPLSRMLFVILNPLLAPGVYWLWLPLIFFYGIINMLIQALGIIIHKIRRPRLALVYSKLFGEMGLAAAKAFLDVVFIPISAINSLNAITITLYRLIISKKHLLMWNAADNVEKSIENSIKGYFKSLGHSSIISAAFVVPALVFAGRNVGVMILYGILTVLWGTSFITACVISRINSNTRNKNRLDKDDILNDTARRAWRFFKTFATKENNWICPDNYQTADKEKIARKTSPTNIGLQFLSILTARDFGFETLSSSLDFTENLLYTVNTLPKWEGHLLNWYNIGTLEALEPRYVSTVDSGNFFGCMIALKNGILEQKDTPVLNNGLISELTKLIRLNNADMKLDGTNVMIRDFLKNICAIRDGLTLKDTGGHKSETDDMIRLIGLAEEEAANFGLHNYYIHDRVTLSKLASIGNKYAVSLLDRISGICKTIDIMLANVNFSLLYNKKRMLFSIGYNTTSQTFDQGCYDLIASESVITSFLAIARGEVSTKHWQKLGRPLAIIRGIPAHVSWSGTMFEYLMPNLLLKEYEGSVFADTTRAVVLQQISYAKSADIPWGISESQYHRFDINSNYQYKAFGVPKLSLKPSYGDSLVVAPYAVMLALEKAGDEALRNLKRIKELKAYGEYGFYEAIDFNSPDPINMTDYCIVKSFMAHHLGMSLVAINNYFNNGIMRRRFHSEPMVKATETLLEEKRQSKFVSITKKGYTVKIKKKVLHEDEILSVRYIKVTAPPIPIVDYFSNGEYSLLITSDGDGFSCCDDIMVNRWRPDIYSQTGSYIYLKDLEQGDYWSVGYNPTKVEADEYQAIFSHHQAEFKRRDSDISTHTTVTLSPNHCLEIRKVVLKNYGAKEKRIAITSYLEVAADSYIAESSHPAFNKLFLESEFIEEHAVFISRRRSGCKEKNPFVMHMVRNDTAHSECIEYENDRMRFIGRNNTLADPDAIKENVSLSNSAGFSDDPIMSLRTCVCLIPGSQATVTFITGLCKSREDVIKISNELGVAYQVDNIIEKFKQQSIMELKYLGISGRQLNAFQNVISPLFYPAKQFRGPVEKIRRNWKDQNSLWRFGISGDNPIMLLKVDSVGEAEIIKGVLKLYEYLRINRVKIDLVILSDSRYGYMHELCNLLNDMTRSLKIYDEKDKPGIFIIYSYQLVPAEVDLLYTVARVVFSESTGIYFRSVRPDIKSIIEEHDQKEGKAYASGIQLL